MIEARQEQIHRFIVTAEQMQAIEERIFKAGMPVAALMEKVAGKITQRILQIWQAEQSYSVQSVGVLVGPGHNGGDALVIARELWFQGYKIKIYCPFNRRKDLTGTHAQYISSLRIPIVDDIRLLKDCDTLIDGLFGFGLEREISGSVAAAIDQLNQWNQPVFSIDLPSGLHTNTGKVLGIAVRATRTFCLGLWKLAFLQDQALEYLGETELIDFDIPLVDVKAVLGQCATVRRITKQTALSSLPLPRHPLAHKYKTGHLLLIAGSRRYTGAAILAGLGARASGVGMLSIAVPKSIKPLLSMQLPEALIISCPEYDDGIIRELPQEVDLSQYDAIACGPGLTTEALSVVQDVLNSDRPLVLDADALNILAQMKPIATLSQRHAPTVITPHPGEFKRLFPQLALELENRILATQKAAQLSGIVVVLKGARVCVGTSNAVTINPHSTPALARGGSGDVLTGLMGGLLAPASLTQQSIVNTVQSALWWHAQAGIRAAQERTELGVDAFTLTQYLNLKVLQEQ
ncbi:MAG: NAD(P)H-hydrate dehydratase [Microcoleaceae cyanobacterium]